MKIKKSRASSSYWTFIVLIVVVIGLAASVYTGVAESQSIKNSLAQRTESLADLVPANEVTSLKGSDEDLKSPIYQALKQRLINVRAANKDIRFVYIMGLKNGQEPFFYVDSEDPSSDGYSPPGQSYPEGVYDVKSIFNSGKSRVLPVERDRWGVWLSGFSPVKDPAGKVVGVFGLDIPARNYFLQISLKALTPLLLAGFIVVSIFWAKRRSKLEKQFLAAKAFFLSFASHEIRSPLTSVAWELRRLTSHEHEHIQKENLVELQNNLHHILSTVDDVLSLQGMERLQAKKLQKSPVSIHKIIEADIQSLLLMSKEHAVKIEDLTSSQDKHIISHVDEALFKRVIANLMVNSIKYAPEKSQVEIALSQTDSHLIISIHNEGPGIPKAEQKKIFEGFYRTKQAEASGQKGSGFGLMLCRDIVVSHGGQLELESDANQGVTFKIILPK